MPGGDGSDAPGGEASNAEEVVECPEDGSNTHFDEVLERRTFESGMFM